MTGDSFEEFIRSYTSLREVPGVPELRLHLADEAYQIWLRTQEELDRRDLPLPYWAFAWVGGQGLARHVLDHPEIVRGRRVLDVASGSGLVALAAVRAGAARVRAVDTDPAAVAAIRLNASVNELDIVAERADATRERPTEDVVLAGDVFYEQPMAEEMLSWLRTAARDADEVLVGDPGRAYVPRPWLQAVSTYSMPTSKALEGAGRVETNIWRLAGHTGPR